MIDRALTLAIAMATDPGSYALLLGSGVSRSVGIPTGWEIVTDLISRVAAAEGTDPGPDLAEWYRGRYGQEPEYSALLSSLSPRPAERTSVLRSYFEATPDEREQGLKMPGISHRAIARLVANQSIRVIVTTNFDRLTEVALAEEGISTVVIANDQAAESAPPPDRSRCTLIKIHGDYLDTRLRNTPEELAAYGPNMTKLLQRILEDYGLVVVGWSAQWDTRLREIVSSHAGRRYSLYWVRRGELSPDAANVVASTQAGVIAAPSSDVFFDRLTDQVGSVSSLARGQAISDRVAIATIKRLLPQPFEYIRLEDFFSDLQTRALAATKGLETPPPDEPDGAYIATLARYEAAATAVAGSAAAIAAWGDESELVARAIRRITRVSTTGGYTHWLALRKYLPSLAFYASCCAAVHRQRMRVLEESFPLRLQIEGQERLASDALGASSVLLAGPVGEEELRIEGKDPKKERRRTPVSDRYLRVLRPMVRDVIPDDGEYETAFERLESVVVDVPCAQDGLGRTGTVRLALVWPSPATASRDRATWRGMAGPRTVWGSR